MKATSLDFDQTVSDASRDRRTRRGSGQAVRQAGYLFAAAGLIGLVNDILPGTVGRGHLASVLLDSLNLAVGVAVLLLSRTRFLLGPAGLVLPLFAMANVAANNAAGVLPPATYGTWFVLIMVWVGIWYPPRTVVALSPAIAAAYLAPLYLGAPTSSGAVPSVLLVVPVTVLAGETIARSVDGVRQAARRQERLLGRLSRESVTDELTGVGNRRLGEMLLDSLEPGDAIAILDIDLFKQVNDTYGHLEGDRVLRELGVRLNDSMRGRDAAARMGGEEFLVVMRGAGESGIDIVSRFLEIWRLGSPLATISAGVAVHKPKASPHDTYAAADRALYEAKHQGRDRAVLARTPCAASRIDEATALVSWES